MTPKEKASNLLRDAVAVMNDNGKHWIQGSLREDLRHSDSVAEFGYCSLGAIYEVTGVNLTSLFDAENNGESVMDLLENGQGEVRDAMIVALSDVLYDNYKEQGETTPFPNIAMSDRFYNITSWNDRGYRKWEDIVEMFEKAAERVEKED